MVFSHQVIIHRKSLNRVDVSDCANFSLAFTDLWMFPLSTKLILIEICSSVCPNDDRAIMMVSTYVGIHIYTTITQCTSGRVRLDLTVFSNCCLPTYGLMVA